MLLLSLSPVQAGGFERIRAGAIDIQLEFDFFSHDLGPSTLHASDGRSMTIM